MLRMLKIRARFYVDHPCVFVPWQKIFLLVPKDSKKLSLGMCKKLALCYCEPFPVHQPTGSSLYHPHLLDGVHSHLIFHVSLKELLGSNDNSMYFEDPSYKPHEPKCILNSKI